MVEWNSGMANLEGKEGSLGHIMCLKRFFHCAAQTPARDHQQYVSKKFLNLAGLQLLPLSTGGGGGGGGILAENWWLTLTQGSFHRGRTSSPTTTQIGSVCLWG